MLTDLINLLVIDHVDHVEFDSLSSQQTSGEHYAEHIASKGLASYQGAGVWYHVKVSCSQLAVALVILLEFFVVKNCLLFFCILYIYHDSSLSRQ